MKNSRILKNIQVRLPGLINDENIKLLVLKNIQVKGYNLIPLQEQGKNSAICNQHTAPTDFLSLDEYHNLKDSITGNSNSH